jgi:hypothetical protein
MDGALTRAHSLPEVFEAGQGSLRRRSPISRFCSGGRSHRDGHKVHVASRFGEVAEDEGAMNVDTDEGRYVDPLFSGPGSRTPKASRSACRSRRSSAPRSYRA